MPYLYSALYSVLIAFILVCAIFFVWYDLEHKFPFMYCITLVQDLLAVFIIFYQNYSI